MNIITDNLNQIIDAPDGIKRLRELILQLAVQGKLVEQRPEDGTAADLLKQIAKAKAADQKNRKANGERVAKEKPLPPITQGEIPYQIPDSWEWVRLGRISLSNDSGWSPQCQSETREELNWGVLKVSAVSWGIFKPEENKALPLGVAPRLECEVKAGDFLLSRANTEELVARSVLVGQAPPRLMMSDKIVRFTFPDNIAPSFINLANLSHASRVYYASKASGTSSSMKNVGREVMCNLQIPLPPLSEQKRIVAKVDELMKWCDELEALKQQREQLRKAALQSALIALTSEGGQDAATRIFDNFAALIRTPEEIKQLRDAILQLAVQGKLVEQYPADGTAADLLKQIAKAKAADQKKRKANGERVAKAKPLPPITQDEIPFEIPDSWEWVRLDNLCDYIQRGKSPKYSEIEEIPVIAQKCIQWHGFELFKAQFIDPETIHSYAIERFLLDGDLLWNSTGLGTLGRIIVFRERFKENFTKVVADSHVTVIRPLQNFIVSDFIFALLAGALIQSKIENMSSGSTKQQELATSTVKSLVIPLPPLPEQKRIVAKVDELIKLCDELEELLKHESETAARFAAAVAKGG